MPTLILGLLGQHQELRQEVALNHVLFMQRNKNTLMWVKSEMQREAVHFYKATESLDLLPTHTRTYSFLIKWDRLLSVS